MVGSKSLGYIHTRLSDLISYCLHRMFDHWAHLGGAAFGALAYWDGGRTWDWLKQMNKGKVEERVKAVVEQMEQENSKSNNA